MPRSAKDLVNGYIDGVSVQFGYDKDGLLTQAGAVTLTLDSQNGRLTATTLGSVTDAYTYDANGLLASYVAKYAGTILYSESVVRDGNNRITQKTEVIGSVSHAWGYSYDVNGRLTDVTEDGQFASHYGYDADDNRTTFTSTTGSITPTYDAQDRLLEYGGITYTYTVNGELTGRTNSLGNTAYNYDPLGNLLSVTPPNGRTISYVIDGENRRVGKKVGGALTQGFLYKDALNVVVQLDSGGNVVSRFVFGSKPNVPDYFTSSADTFRILSDHLGSPRLVVNTASGSVVEEIDYDEFGNVTNDTSPGLTPFGFAGGLYDADTRLVRFGARDYDASVGRWTSKDRIRFGGGMNLYGYVVNDPVNRLDWFGLDGTDCSYYDMRCAQNGGSYYCDQASGAPYWCGFFGHSPWADCTRQCLQECDASSNPGTQNYSPGYDPDLGICPSTGELPDNSMPWSSTNNFACHAECYTYCAGPGANVFF
jgi:RHS repeat-associated protein